MMHASPSEQPWIDAGYEAFALQGPEALRVEQLARIVGIGKSSFYHHFVDMEVFTDRLFQHHHARAKAMANEVRALPSFDPHFLHLLVAHRLDALFQRQLRMRRENVEYQYTFQRADDLLVEAALPAWADRLGIAHRMDVALSIFQVVTDVFYQRLTNENLSHAWLTELLTSMGVFTQYILRKEGIAPALIPKC